MPNAQAVFLIASISVVEAVSVKVAAFPGKARSVAWS